MNYSSSTNVKPTTTAYAEKVYCTVRNIPKGKVSTYGAVAQEINSHARAVGQALKKNPYAPEVPCHRVVSASRAIGGYFGNITEASKEVQQKRKMLLDEGVKFDENNKEMTNTEEQGDSVILEEEIDESYEPTEAEVKEYAEWLGMDIETEKDLFWIAREGLKAPLPENWKPCKTKDTDEIYYFNFNTGESKWDHPCDEFYKEQYAEIKKKKMAKQGKSVGQESQEKRKKEREDVAELLGKKKKKDKKKPRKLKDLGGISSNLDKKPLPGISSPLASSKPLASKSIKLASTSSSVGISREPSAKTNDSSSSDEEKTTTQQSTSTTSSRSFKSRLGLPQREESENDSKKKLSRKKSATESNIDRLRSEMDLERLEDDIDQKRRKLKRDWDRERESMEDEIYSEKLKHKEALLEKRTELEDELKDLKKVFAEKASRYKDELESQKAEEVSSVKKEIDRKIQKLTKDYDNEMTKLKQRFTNRKNDAMKDHEEQLEECNLEYEKSLQASKEKLRDLEEEWDQKLTSAQEKLDDRRKMAGRERILELEAENKKWKEQMRESEKENESLVEDKAELVSKYDRLRDRYESLSKSNEKSSSTSDNQKELDSLRDENDKLSLECEKSKREFDKNVAQWKKERKELESQIQKEKNDVVAKEKQLQEEKSKAEKALKSLEEKKVAEKQQVLNAKETTTTTSSTSKLTKANQVLEKSKVELIKKVESMKDENSKLQESKIELETAKLDLEQKVKSLESEKKTIEKALRSKTTTESTSDNQWQVDQLNAKLQSASETESLLTQRNSSMMSELKEHMERIRNLEKENHNHMISNNSLMSDKTSLENRLTSSEAQVSGLMQKIQSVSIELQEAKTEQAKLQSNVEGLESQVKVLTNDKEHLEKKLSSLKEAKEELEARVKTEGSLRDEVQSKVSQLASDKIGLEQQVRLLKEENTVLEHAKQGGGGGAQDELLQSRLSDLLTERETLEEQLRETQKERGEVQNLLRNLKTEYAESKSLLASEKKETEVLSTRNSKLVLDFETAEATARKLRYEKEASESNFSRLKAEIQDIENRLSRKTQDYKEVQLQQRDTENQRDEFENKNRALSFELSTLNSRMDRTQAEIASTESRVSHLVDENEELTRKLQHQSSELQTEVAKSRNLAREVASISDEARSTTKDNSDLENEIADLQDRVKEMSRVHQAECDLLQEKLRESTESLTQDKAAALAKEKDIWSQRLTSMEDERDKLIQQNNTLRQNEKLDYQQKLNLLQESNAALTKDKEELQAMLLAKGKTTVFSPRTSDNGGNQQQSHDMAVIKYKLAESARNELQERLDDVTIELERITSKLSVSENRCRDQAQQLESLNVDLASLRANCQTMHLSALETLSAKEKIEYERKKSLLSQEYAAMLRDFESQEADALLRHKARIRSSSERKLDEVVEEKQVQQKLRLQQINEETSDSLQQIRLMHQNKVQEVKQKLKKELHETEVTLRTEKERKIKKISQQLSNNEEEIRKRLRDKQQVNRAEEIVSNTQSGKRFPGEILDNQPDDDIEEQQQPINNKWQVQLEQELNLINKAKAMMKRQKKELKLQSKRLVSAKNNWKKDCREFQQAPFQDEHGQRVLHQMRMMLDKEANALNQSIRELRETQKWITKRESKVQRMQSTIWKMSGAELDEDDDDNDDDVNNNRKVNGLDTLERLSFELQSDASEVSASDIGQSSSFDDDLNAYEQSPLPYDEIQPYPFYHHHSGLPPPPYRQNAGGFQSLSSFGYGSGGGPAQVENYWMLRSRPATDRVYPMTSLNGPAQSRVAIYQKQISHWAAGRQKVQHAAVKHASWLSDLVRELQHYGTRGEKDVMKNNNDDPSRFATVELDRDAMELSELEPVLTTE